jgi:hypothetical protein
VEGPRPAGRFFAAGGADLLNAGLYELSFAPPRMRALTDVTRISTLGACPTMLVVAAAQAEVGFADRIQRFRQGRFEPVPGLGSPKAHDPDLRPDCRMLFNTVDRANPQRLAFRLHVWDPGTGTDEIVHTTAQEEEIDYGWGPGGRIGIIVRSRVTPNAPVTTAYGIIIIEPDGSVKRLPVPDPEIRGLLWAEAGWMALGLGDRGNMFLQPDTGERHDLLGWEGLAWSPDGRQLLVLEDGSDTSLGVVDITDLAKVQRLGDADVPVYDTVWLPAGAEPLD